MFVQLTWFCHCYNASKSPTWEAFDSLSSPNLLLTPNLDRNDWLFLVVKERNFNFNSSLVDKREELDIYIEIFTSTEEKVTAVMEISVNSTR